MPVARSNAAIAITSRRLREKTGVSAQFNATTPAPSSAPTSGNQGNARPISRRVRPARSARGHSSWSHRNNCEKLERKQETVRSWLLRHDRPLTPKWRMPLIGVRRLRLHHDLVTLPTLRSRAWQIRPARMEVRHALKGVGDAQQRRLAKVRPDQLQPNRQALAEPARDGDATVARQIRRDSDTRRSDTSRRDRRPSRRS